MESWVGAVELFEDVTEHRRQVHNFDVMERIAHVQWDTLLFFYGVILCVAGLGEFGYLTLVSGTLYTDLGPTLANTLVGVLSAVCERVLYLWRAPQMDAGDCLGVRIEHSQPSVVEHAADVRRFPSFR